MNKHFKQFIAVTLTLTLIFHGLVLSYFAVVEDAVEQDEIAYFSSSFIGDVSGDTPMLSGSDQLVIVSSKSSLSGDSFLGYISAVYSFHYKNGINTTLKISQNIDLIFDIKKLKFPTHYFW